MQVLEKAGLAGLSDSSTTNGPVIAAGGGLVGVNGAITILGHGRLGFEEAILLALALQPDELILLLPPYQMSRLRDGNLKNRHLAEGATYAILPVGNPILPDEHAGVVKLRGAGQGLPRGYDGRVIRRPGDDVHRFDDSTSVKIVEPEVLQELLNHHFVRQVV